MAAMQWKAGDDVYDLMFQLIGQNFPELAILDKKIGIKFREKAGKKGAIPTLSNVGKAPPILDVFGDGEYEFIIELAYDMWVILTDIQKEALMFHCLSGLSVEEVEGDDDKNGTGYKTGINPPDIQAFSDEITKYGNWRPSVDQVKAALKQRGEDA